MSLICDIKMAQDGINRPRGCPSLLRHFLRLVGQAELVIAKNNTFYEFIPRVFVYRRPV